PNVCSTLACLRMDLVASAPPFAKKILKHCSTFVFQNTGSDITLVIQRGHLEKVDHASCRPGCRISAAKNHTPDPSMDDPARAHRTRLLGHIQIAVRQSPITHGFLSLG